MTDSKQAQTNAEDLNNEVIQAETEGGKKEKTLTPAQQLGSLREKIEIKEEVKKSVEKNTRSFFTKIFGAGMISSFLTKVFGFFRRKKQVPWEDITKSVEGEYFDPEKFIIAHRGMGYGREKENSQDALKAALDAGENGMEIDLRKGKDGVIYLHHDKIDDQPPYKYSKLEDVLELFASHSNQEAVFFFDIKEDNILPELESLIANIDRKNASRSDYKPLKDRHFINSFNAKILQESIDKNTNRPVMFCYVPTCTLPLAKTTLQNMKEEDIKKTLLSIDKLTDNLTNLGDDYENTSLELYKTSLDQCKYDKAGVMHIYDELPSKDIIQSLRKCGGYICIPAMLATEKLVNKAHAEGLKVAVWGAESSQIKRAIAVNDVDLVISKTPKLQDKVS